MWLPFYKCLSKVSTVGLKEREYDEYEHWLACKAISKTHSYMSQNIVCVQLEKTGCFNHACIIQEFTIDSDPLKRDKMRDSLFSQFTRGGSRVVATSEMECFVIIVNGFQPLTITTKHSILDIAAALDSPLFTTYLRCGQIDFGANLLSFSPA